MNTIRIQTVLLCLLLAAMCVLKSCTKNELVPYEREPLNKIQEYKVVNNPQHMMGAIDHETNTIKVFIPYYTNLDFLIANMKLDEGATLLRADSTVINLLEDELDPVAIGDTVKYIVRSAEGQYRTYTLTQEVLPHTDPLAILGYGNQERMGAFNFELHTMEDGDYDINANKIFYLFGNFYSSSSLGKFILTNRATGATHEDYVRIASVTPQAENRYVMTARIASEALYGTYDVTLEHQGRSTILPPVNISYKLNFGPYYSSSAAFAQGDTIVFDAENATFAKPKQLYARVNKSTREGDVPPNFPEDLYGKNLDMKIVSATRSQIKAIFPDIPAGLYKNFQSNVINLFAIYEEEAGFEEGTLFNTEVKIAHPSGLGFSVLPKQP
ncbi:hypothetical protein [Sphingobacterium corticibacter]|uniref:DUF4249 domain-containing protein n=1 Tax=Sphingobacterium corticibacter TaxID=2171749 RepID=A0A2T8HGM3_9SPHI|nr:hypothetical protein [Sphingobacterium corticibacter]PVH24554.1 hypothetical protein DC487_13550 [Sphingobacterium corticibacter]